MKVYEFPQKGQPPNAPKANTAVENRKLYLGPVSFTCPHCDNTSELHHPGMIFRAIEFHCGDCGSYFKVTNPAFTAPPPPPPKKPK